MIIDATDLIIGRMATVVAKKALLGEKVDIINCEKALISGSKKDVLAKFKARRERGQPTKGPFIPRRPDMLVKRTIRGMLPYKQEKGLKAFKRIKCYLGVPEGMEKAETIKEAHISKLPTLKYITIGTLSRELGWQR